MLLLAVEPVMAKSSCSRPPNPTSSRGPAGMAGEWTCGLSAPHLFNIPDGDYTGPVAADLW
ncbi:hypothetical protein WOLCODRAFT_162678 [Wolfiporia cocos MD-104 SS10]|uniref:Uncharacterized protein n=1 Tax=Wolfiporia cocos (strain MD-104) TaxID=742152 RepID=A0A2H3JM48_WOLCO|nr:hypothetical protein WOLCODRAFT_162678 [Wolfiporia cocos MD-104 SS10]